jgi:hypothetical protein
MLAITRSAFGARTVSSIGARNSGSSNDGNTVRALIASSCVASMRCVPPSALYGAAKRPSPVSCTLPL